MRELDKGTFRLLPLNPLRVRLMFASGKEFEGQQQPLLYIHVDDTERHALALKAGFALVATVAGRYSIYRMETKG